MRKQLIGEPSIFLNSGQVGLFVTLDDGVELQLQLAEDGQTTVDLNVKIR